MTHGFNVAAAGSNLGVTGRGNDGANANRATANVATTQAGGHGVPPAGAPPAGPAITPPPAAAPAPAGTGFPGANTIPVTHSTLGANRQIQRSQASVAAAGLPNAMTFPPAAQGQRPRSRNPDQVDILDAMNQQTNAAIGQLASLASSMHPSAPQLRATQLEAALDNLYGRLEKRTNAGLDTTAIEARIELLETELENHQDTMLGL